jgi:hypothetical protein
MIDVGDMRKFAQAFGKWLYGVNPNLDADKLKTAIQQFATSAPIGGGDTSALSLDEFCTEALKGYAPGEESSEV